MPDVPHREGQARGPLVVGVTGGIAAGKSSFCRAMVALGGVVHLDADAFVHRLLAEDSAVQRAVRERFGGDLFGPDGRPDRTALAARVFGDARARAELESILHPAVRALLAERLERLRRQEGIAIVLLEIPLLAETGRPPWVDRVVTIEAPESVRRARLAEKGFSQAEASRRLRAQASRAERAALADEVIQNATSLAALQAVARARWRAWRKRQE
ncbi:MAG: dephospho-CoA kinase [Candidatus Eisenbacteria bacterium]|nr:dephospho-CoA kinase [Candidatus Eisenbacteria bacterium]